jgi:RES domain-containing protein
VEVWRICRKEHAADPLSGKGGLVTAGRWHARGTRVTYASGSLSLAALEVLVHGSVAVLPADLMQVQVHIPDDLPLKEIAVSSLPRNWRAYPAPPSLQAIGGEWLRSAETAVLRVPSAVIPSEGNYLLNPAHEDARRIRVVQVEKFILDPRLAR